MRRKKTSRFTRCGIILLTLFAAVGAAYRPASAAGQTLAITGIQDFPLQLAPAAARLENGRLVLAASSGSLALPIASIPLAVAAQAGQDPQLLASTYLGGSTWDSAYAVAVDSAGAVYVAGETPAADFPLTGGFGNPSAAQLDAFLVKIAPGGAAVEYAVLLGGGSLDSVFALQVENGIVYLAGETWSRTFPDGAAPAGENDVWAAAVTPDGSGLIYAVRFGGSDQDRAGGLSVQDGRVTLTGVTWSADFPAAAFHGGADVFVMQLGPTGAMERAVLIGGSDVDAGFGLGQNNGQTLVCGQTWSRNFPLRGLRGQDDGFVMLLDENLAVAGGALIGGSGEDSANACAFAADGSILAAGRTSSSDLAAGGPLQGESDAFVVRLSTSGTLEEVVRLGGSNTDGAQALAIGQGGSVWVAGMSNSTDFPVTGGAAQSSPAGAADAFIAGFNMADLAAGAQYASLLGGSGNDYAQALAAGSNGLLVMAGYTQSANFPITGSPLYGSLNGSQDAFIAWLGAPAAVEVLPTATAQPVVPTGTPVPTLSEEEISTAETAGPPPAPTEAGQATATAVSSALAATVISETPQTSMAAGGATATLASGENATAVATATENPAVPGRNQPLLGWLLGVLTFAAAGFGVYWFLRRKKVA